MGTFSISIIVITCNNPTIYECLHSVKQQMDKNDEIIVVDDHSSKEYWTSLQAYCIRYAIRLLSTKIHGNRAHNRNLGAHKAKNPVLLFLDADMVLLDSSLPAIKAAYATKSHAAYIGTRSAGRYDPLRMRLFTGIDIPEVVQQKSQFHFLSTLFSVQDSRINSKIYTENLPEQKYYWIYYFSCCCTVLRDLFDKIGGFDESFMGWGVEDVDLGYRISLNGTLSFLRGFHGIHVPHNRETLYAEQDNCRNLKQLLKKSQRFDVELIAVYRMSAIQLETAREYLSRLQILRLSHIHPVETRDTLYINCISLDTPYGQIVHFDQSGMRKTYEMLGMATFFEDNSISTVIISSNIVLYPASVICGIIQEGLRIGKEVFLKGALPSFRLDWKGFPNLTCLQPQRRNEYRIHDMMELKFEKMQGEDIYLIKSDYLELEPSKQIPQKLPLQQATKERYPTCTYCAINLTRGTGYKLLLLQLQEMLNIRLTGIYSAEDYTVSNQACPQFPEYLYGLLSLRTPIVLIVKDLEQFSLNFPMWTEREHISDIVVDFEGHFLRFTD